jgi:hypothetical protein
MITNMITNKNIRNLKDVSKLDNLKLNKYNKMLLKKRECVEHSRKNFIFLLTNML